MSRQHCALTEYTVGGFFLLATFSAVCAFREVHDMQVPPQYTVQWPHEVCDSPNQAAHYHTLGPKLEAPSLTRHLACLGAKVVFKRRNLCKI
jgi:hypothetical protein